jgi:hypothetical protein
VCIDDCIGHQVRQIRQFAFPAFDRMQRLDTPLFRVRLLLIVSRNPGIQIPAQIIEPDLRVCQCRLNLSRCLLLQVVKTGHYIRHLHACIVDVILHFHEPCPRAQHADKCIAQNGIPKMADMRCFIRVDIRVFDNDLFACSGLLLRFMD